MPRRKALKVIADVHLHAVTCPGVLLPEHQHVLIYVEMLGHRKKTQTTSPVFPFLFHEKLRFDKVFSQCTDPVHVASALNEETILIELVQYADSGGELLASYEDNVRNFLFPTPRACPAYPGVDREVLLQRSSNFSGIAPRLEFSSRTVIKEVTSVSSTLQSSRKKRDKRKTENGSESLNYRSPCCLSSKQRESSPVQTSTPHLRNSRSLNKKKAEGNTSAARSGRSRTRASSSNRDSTRFGYEQPTVASMSRSPSPYTRRRMAELSIKDPFDSTVKTKPFKTDLEDRPDFVVRKVSSNCLSFNRTPPSPRRVSPAAVRRALSSSPTRRAKSPSGRKQTPGPTRYYASRSRDYDSDDSEDESSEDEIRFTSKRLQALVGSYAARHRCNKLKSAFCQHTEAMPATSNADLKSFMKDKETQKDFEIQRLVNNSKESREAQQSSSDESARGSEKVRCCRCQSRVTFKNTTELMGNSSPHQRQGGFPNRSKYDRSETESTSRPVTPRRDLSFSRADLDFEPQQSRLNDYTEDMQRNSFSERFRSNSPSPYEKIRDRVRSLLATPTANQIVDDSVVEANVRYWKRKSRSPSPRSSPRSTISVPLGNGEYWNELTSEMIGRPHRQVFEESIDKIYDGIYSHMRQENN